MVDREDILEEIEREEKRDSVAGYIEKTRQIKREINRLKKLIKSSISSRA